MPLTVAQPISGEAFGPGFRIEASSDFIGPLEPGSFWLIELTAPANEDLVARWEIQAFSVILSTTFFNRPGSQVELVPGRSDWATGQSGQLRVQLIEPIGGVLEDEAIPIVLDREAGANVELMEVIRPYLVSGAQTLSTEEHAALLQTNVGVLAMSQLNPLDLIGDLAEAISGSPPLGFGSMSTTYNLTGDGEMPDVGDVLHTKLGIYFVATVIPVGLSHKHGQSQEYPARLVQWRTVHTVGGIELVTEVIDFETHGELWRWRQAKPTRIEYSVLPGVTIQARWWQFP